MMSFEKKRKIIEKKFLQIQQCKPLHGRYGEDNDRAAEQ